MTQSGDVGDSGYLYKWTAVVKGWKKRYFVLDKSGVLRYYRDADSIADVRGEILLDTATIEVKEKKDYFAIRSPSVSKPWWIKCEDKNAWIQKLSKYARISRNGHSQLPEPPSGALGKQGINYTSGPFTPPTMPANSRPTTPPPSSLAPVAASTSPTHSTSTPASTTTAHTSVSTSSTTTSSPPSSKTSAARRLSQKEEEQSQRRVVTASVTLFYVATLFVFSASDSLKWILVATILYVMFLYSFSSISSVLLDLVSKGDQDDKHKSN
eukprot:TRINITY_DN7019_c0_g1_i1.p2 TRINITY_DN7019_c0_g1~~TRINITY_DN7019_c0_g1_i1.p2  ORF type:complete len:268 (-),score=50.56 TRINITY_DN7019_c0_g1_i1:211-1014(-)